MTPHRIYDATHRSIFEFFKGHIKCTDEEAEVMTQEELEQTTLNYFVNDDTHGLVDMIKGSQLFVVGKVFENIDRAKIYQLKKLINEYVMDTRMGDNISYGEYISMKQELDTLGEIYPEDLV